MRAFFLPLLLSLAVTGFAQSAKRAALPTTPPASLQVERDIEYGRTAEQRLLMDVYRPKQGGDKLPACVLVHGGGWTGGDKERFTPLAIALAQRGYVVANIEYRLAGAAHYPAAVQDCNAAVRFVRAHAKRFGLDPDRVGTWGGSAGGHLVALQAAAPENPKFVAGDRKTSAQVRAVVVMAGPTELNSEKFIAGLRQQKEASSGFKWIGKLYDDAPELYREASPLTHLDRHAPAFLFLRGSLDNPEADVAAWEKLKSLAVPTERRVLADGKHGCWFQHPWFEQCVDAVDQFFQRHLK